MACQLEHGRSWSSQLGMAVGLGLGLGLGERHGLVPETNK